MHWQIEPMQSWPYEETRSRRSSPFRATWSDTLNLLERELGYLGARGAIAMRVVADDADIRLDGMLRARAKVLHPGVALSFQSKYGPLSYPCDTFSGSWQSNARAIALALEALRKVDRYGVTKHGEQYAGWRAIEAPAPAGFSSVSEALAWLREFTQSSPDVPVANLLRKASRQAHPDAGGSPEDWNRVDAARQIVEKNGGGR